MQWLILFVYQNPPEGQKKKKIFEEVSLNPSSETSARQVCD